MSITFITGNPNKAAFLAENLGIEVSHQKADLAEIQSTDLREVVTDKAKRAFEIVGSSVLVEDVSLEFAVLKGLPGPFVRWFESKLGVEGLAKLLDGYSDRSATARIMYCLYDGREPQIFEGVMQGIIAKSPRGENGFGWDAVFEQEGYGGITRAEMDQIMWAKSSYRMSALAALRVHIENNQS